MSSYELRILIINFTTIFREKKFTPFAMWRAVATKDIHGIVLCRGVHKATA